MAVRPSRFLVTPTAALLALTVLAGCGSDNDEAAPAESSASSTSAAATTAAAEETSSATAETSSAPAVEPELPAGYKLVTAPNNGISFGVPEGWLEMDSEALANDAEIQAYLEQAGAETGMQVEDLQEHMAQLDLSTMSMTPDAAGFSENVNVSAEPIPASQPPTAADATSMVEGIGGTVGAFAEVETALGEGITQAYSANIAGVAAEGMYVIVPSGTGSGYSIITVSTSDAAKAQEIADNIVKSLQKS